MHSIQFYLAVNEKSYDADAKKIVFMLSYMTEGSALTCANTVEVLYTTECKYKV